MNTFTRRYVAELRADREPTRRALAMLVAIRQHVTDVIEDDPGDDDTTAWEDARTYLASVEDALRAAMKGGAR